MNAWTDSELATVDRVDELHICSHRSDGTTTRPVVIWVVRAGDRVFMRSVHGRGAGWFKGTRLTGTGRLSIGGVERDVAFTEVTDPAKQEAIARHTGPSTGGGTPRASSSPPSARMRSRRRSWPHRADRRVVALAVVDLWTRAPGT